MTAPARLRRIRAVLRRRPTDAAATEEGRAAPSASLFGNISLDLAKFIVSLAIPAMLFMGYCYTLGFYRTLGIHTSEIKMDYTELTIRAFFVMQRTEGLFNLLLLILISYVIFYLTRRWGRFRVPALAVAFVTTIFLVGQLGIRLGRDDATALGTGTAGRRAYCALKPESATAQRMPYFAALAADGHYSKVIENEKTLYLVDTKSPNAIDYLAGKAPFWGATLALNKEDVVVCSVFGT